MLTVHVRISNTGLDPENAAGEGQIKAFQNVGGYLVSTNSLVLCDTSVLDTANFCMVNVSNYIA